MEPPELSVIIATHNRTLLLQRCLRSICAQTQPPETFEVVIVDDGSTDGTGAMLEELRTPFRLRLVRLEKVGRPGARNAGIKAAEGKVCLLFDDDMVAAPDLFAVHLDAHRAEPRALAIGRITQQPRAGRDWYAHSFARAWNRHYDHLSESEAGWADAFGANVSVSRQAVIAVGGFATPALPVGQDLELAFRLCRSGCSPRYLPRARAVHDDQKPGRRILEESRIQGVTSVELSQREPAMMPTLLGWFLATTPREIGLRRLMLALRVNPTALARLGPFVPGRGRQEKWFDFVSRFAFWRGVRRSVNRPRWAQITHGVPVLLYHAFGGSEPTDRYVVPQRSFARQMRLLALLRYRVIDLDGVASALRDNRLMPARALAITIDDGYADNLSIAHPILRRRHFPATIFLISQRIGRRNDWTIDGALHARRLLDADEIARLDGAEIRFGAHTRTHCPLPDVSTHQLEEEIRGSRVDLEQRLGTSILTFAYPYGRHDERAVDVVRSTGFTGAFTVQPRPVRPDDDPLLIPRIEIEATDSLTRFLIKLWFGGA